MSYIITKMIENQFKNIVGTAIRDYQDEAKGEMEYWSEQDEAECKRQVCDELIDIITTERNC